MGKLIGWIRPLFPFRLFQCLAPPCGTFACCGTPGYSCQSSWFVYMRLHRCTYQAVLSELIAPEGTMGKPGPGSSTPSPCRRGSPTCGRGCPLGRCRCSSSLFRFLLQPFSGPAASVPAALSRLLCAASSCMSSFLGTINTPNLAWLAYFVISPSCGRRQRVLV